MDDALEVIDSPEVEVEEGLGEVEEGLETELEESEPEPEAKESDDPYTTKYSREMRAALKAWEAANPEASKYAKQARDNHARLFALNQVEPKGIDGVREKYALLENLSDGDLRGAEALTSMQERLQATQEVDNLLAAGDAKALDALGEDFNPGLAKLAPAILDRVMASDPQAYAAAVLPHFVQALGQSELLKDFNSLVDILNTKDDPRLDEPTKLRMTMQHIGKMAAWFNAQEAKAGSLKTAPTADPDRAKFDEERTTFEKERQEQHWNTQIKPDAVKMENDKFAEMFKPLAPRLRLTEVQQKAALTDFKAKIGSALKSDADYMKQLGIYRNQKNPDPVAVKNFLKVSLQKKASAAFNEVKAERWDSFLAGKPKPGVKTPAVGGKPAAPVAPGVEIRSVKPQMHEIDHRNTPLDWLAQKKYKLYSGKVVQVRANA